MICQCVCLRHRKIIDLLATDKSRYLARPRPIIDKYFKLKYHIKKILHLEYYERHAYGDYSLIVKKNSTFKAPVLSDATLMIMQYNVNHKFGSILSERSSESNPVKLPAFVRLVFLITDCMCSCAKSRRLMLNVQCSRFPLRSLK